MYTVNLVTTLGRRGVAWRGALPHNSCCSLPLRSDPVACCGPVSRSQLFIFASLIWRVSATPVLCRLVLVCHEYISIISIGCVLRVKRALLHTVVLVSFHLLSRPTRRVRRRAGLISQERMRQPPYRPRAYSQAFSSGRVVLLPKSTKPHTPPAYRTSRCNKKQGTRPSKSSPGTRGASAARRCPSTSPWRTSARRKSVFRAPSPPEGSTSRKYMVCSAGLFPTATPPVLSADIE